MDDPCPQYLVDISPFVIQLQMLPPFNNIYSECEIWCFTYIFQRTNNIDVVCSSCSAHSMYFLFLLADVTNTVLNVTVTTNPANAVECKFEPGYTCIIDYGTDSSYTNLMYIDNSTTLGQVATIALSRKLQRDTVYYYIVSAESNSQCVGVRGTFTTGGFYLLWCTLLY